MPAYTTHLTLGGRISGGHFGDVFEGQCQVQGRVAVKVLRQDPNESAAEWAQRSTTLLDEAQKLQAAKHPNVVEVHQVVRDQTNNVVHLVAEYCDGGSVETLYQNGPLTVVHVRKIVTDVCRGLECVHSNGMVHRDIKPGNILAKANSYKIADFGLVTDKLLLGYGSVAGYTSHLAPEVFGVGGAPGVTSAKTDIWALGMTVYRLLHGHAFYQDNFGLWSSDDFRNAIVNGGFSRRLPWLPHVPDAWRKFVRKAMHDDPGQRLPTAHATSQALALLPTNPAWTCQYSFNNTRWEKNEGTRLLVVEHQVHSPRKHEWSAHRTGGAKRTMLIGGKPGKIISASEARTQLETFFTSSV